MVEAAALSRGHEIVSIIDPKGKTTHISAETLADGDICIDFSRQEHVVDNIRKIAALKKNIIVGTTGWYEHLNNVKDIVNESGIGLLYAPNFSFGVALFLEMITHAADLIAPHRSYDVGGMEIHHNKKADSPSGTSLAITQKLLDKMPHKKSVIYDRQDGGTKPHEIHFSSCRVGSATGTHTVIFDSPTDSITLTHSAKNREGFAEGAIQAAEWLHNKKGFYTFEDIMPIPLKRATGL